MELRCRNQKWSHFAANWWGNMKYNLITLKMFLSVARMGSISQASEVENVAASAISKRISDLEDQIGTPLIIQALFFTE